MNQQVVVDLAYQALLTTLYIAAPLLGLALLVGLAVSIFQATTQIQEQTLAFVPKILAVLLSLLLFGPWILSTLVDFTYALLSNLHNNIG
ncbi:MAG: flagellar biosynthesis protein FliQ [Gorillibacterium sp.]|nr:flagellar biosynthesis protein FliQ [Gorillibacterium sp.]